jgi:hypothetical protein
MKKLFVFYVILTLCLMFLTFSFACPVEFRFANPPKVGFHWGAFLAPPALWNPQAIPPGLNSLKKTAQRI